jgi:hypothetical protein
MKERSIPSKNLMVQEDFRFVVVTSPRKVAEDRVLKIWSRIKGSLKMGSFMAMEHYIIKGE